MFTITHTAQCRDIGDLVEALAIQIRLASAAGDGRVFYALAETASRLCDAQSAACSRCHVEQP